METINKNVNLNGIANVNGNGNGNTVLELISTKKWVIILIIYILFDK